MEKFTLPLISILTAIIGVAIIAVLVSKNANTGDVIQKAGQAFSQILGVAVSPVNGSSNSSGQISLGTLGSFYQ